MPLLCVYKPRPTALAPSSSFFQREGSLLVVLGFINYSQEVPVTVLLALLVTPRVEQVGTSIVQCEERNTSTVVVGSGWLRIQPINHSDRGELNQILCNGRRVRSKRPIPKAPRKTPSLRSDQNYL